MAEVINGLSCHYSCRITRAGGQKGLMYLKWHIKRINSSFICKVHWLSSQSSKIPLMKQLAKWLHISASRGAELPCWRGKQVIIIHTLRFLIRCAELGNQLQSRPLFQSIHVQACGLSIATAYEKPRATAPHLQSTLFFCIYLTPTYPKWLTGHLLPVQSPFSDPLTLISHNTVSQICIFHS